MFRILGVFSNIYKELLYNHFIVKIWIYRYKRIQGLNKLYLLIFRWQMGSCWLDSYFLSLGSF